MLRREGFQRFLVHTPLVPSGGVSSEGEGEDADPSTSQYKVPYGSYHQLYRLDGKLVAVRENPFEWCNIDHASVS